MMHECIALSLDSLYLWEAICSAMQVPGGFANVEGT